MQSNPGSSFHVLIVERDELFREVFRLLLSSQGYTFDITGSPCEALEMAKRNVPDVIFSSLVFSEMSGFELCRRLREIPEIARKLIVALSGYGAKGIREEAVSAGFDEFIAKPADIKVLLALLNAERFKRDVANLTQNRQ